MCEMDRRRVTHWEHFCGIWAGIAWEINDPDPNAREHKPYWAPRGLCFCPDCLNVPR